MRTVGLNPAVSAHHDPGIYIVETDEFLTLEELQARLLQRRPAVGSP